LSHFLTGLSGSQSDTSGLLHGPLGLLDRPFAGPSSRFIDILGIFVWSSFVVLWSSVCHTIPP